MPTASVTAILAAAGAGVRFGGADSKLFAPLAGQPILLWSFRALLASPSISDVVVVASRADRERVTALLAGEPRLRAICQGGAERCDSVRNALAHVAESAEYVAVHDAARPAASPALIERVIAAARAHRAAAPALPVTDTLKHSLDGTQTLATQDRREFFTVQTPQVFERELLVSAYEQARASGFAGTDDASFVERTGVPVRLVPGDAENLKITHPEDLERAARALGGGSRQVIRTGIGYDVHRLAAERTLVLGGVTIPHPRGLEGHSDADVLLHAICDALLGAAALGDIGEHYPNTDEQWRGASSLKLLRDVARQVQRAGWQVLNVDVMLLAEAPRIRPYVGEMTMNVAAALHVSTSQVNIKATTGEGMGFIGREEGMAAYAVATLSLGM